MPPVGVSPAMYEQPRDLVPRLPHIVSLQREGVDNGLTRDRELQGWASVVKWGRGPCLSGLLRAGLHTVWMGRQGDNGRSDERGIQERVQGARPLGVDHVQIVDRFVQPDDPFHGPAHPIEVRNLLWSDSEGQIRQKDTAPLGDRKPYEAYSHSHFRLPDINFVVPNLNIEPLGFLREQGIKVGTREKLSGKLPPRKIISLRLLIFAGVDHQLYLMQFAGLQPHQTRIGQVCKRAIAPSGLITLPMLTIMFPRRTEMAPHWQSTAHRDPLMHLERYVVPYPGKLLAQSDAYCNHRRLDDIPLSHATQWVRQIHLLGLGVCRGMGGQHFQKLFQGLIKLSREGGTSHIRHLNLQIGAQDVHLQGATQRPGGDHHSLHEHRQVQFAIVLHHTKLLAEAGDLLRQAHRARNSSRLKLYRRLFPQDLGLSGHV